MWQAQCQFLVISSCQLCEMPKTSKQISKHLKGCSVPRVRHFFADAKDFVIFLFPDSFRIQRILPFSCFWTLSVFKGFCPFPVSRHFPYSRDFVVSLFPDTFFPYSKILLVLLFPDIFFPYSKILLFLLFPDTFFPYSKTKPSAAGARRGVCNCIQTTITLGPAGRRPARA